MERQTFLIADKMLDSYVRHVLAVCITVSEDTVNCVEGKLIHDDRPVLCSNCLYAVYIHNNLITSYSIISDLCGMAVKWLVIKRSCVRSTPGISTGQVVNIHVCLCH